MDLFSLQGKIALVTGARCGLGQGIAVALAQAGADVVGVSRGDMSETAGLIEREGRRFHPIRADLTTTEPIADILTQIIAVFGRLDILVNNAGIIRRAAAIDVTEVDFDAVMNTDLRTLFFLSQAAARQFRVQGTGGKIIHIASMLSYQGGIRVPAYTAAKSAVMGLTRAMANEWAKEGICVNAIAPGYMETDNTAPLRNNEARREEITARIPAGRWGLPADLAGCAVFLASAASDYVHGATIPVDGGWLAR